jgi:uncharacterized protein
MTGIFLAGLSLGTIGSFHCIGMCGPLAFSLPLADKSDFAKFAGSFLYNAGRILTYSALGLLFGLAGKSFSLFGFQQGLSIAVGTSILFFLFLPKRWFSIGHTSNLFSSYTYSIRAVLGNLFVKKNYSSLFAIGLLNGLLPCGLIYMAMAVAVSSADPVKSVLFMASFGLGTLPVMWSVSFFGNYIGAGVRRKIRTAYPVMMVLMACLLIVRGMGLGIRYISPAMNNKTSEVQICHPEVKNVSHDLR